MCPRSYTLEPHTVNIDGGQLIFVSFVRVCGRRQPDALLVLFFRPSIYTRTIVLEHTISGSDRVLLIATSKKHLRIMCSPKIQHLNKNITS